MSVVKKSAALILALLMVMTIGAQIAFSSMDDISIKSVDGPSSSYKKDDKISVDFTVQHDKIGKDLIKEGENVIVTLEDCDFKTGTTTNMYIYSHTQAGTVLKSEYRVHLKNIVAKGTGNKLKIRVKKTTVGTPYDEVIEVGSIAGYDDGTGGSSSSEPDKPATPTASNANYTLYRVRGYMKEGTSFKPNDNATYFDLNNLGDNRGDSTIRQYYYADITLRIFDDKGPAPLGISSTDIVPEGKSMDMGSFYFQNGVSSVTVLDTVTGYYEVKFEALRYSGNGNKINFRTKKDSYIGDVTAEIGECYTKKDSDKDSANNNNDDDDDDSKLEVETPYVIVSKYSFGGSNVTAGDTFPLNLTIYNTSETEVVGNMMITITMPDGLMLTSSSNTFYVEELDKKASINKTVQVTAKVDAKAQSHTVDVAMKYQYVDDRVNSRRSAETTEKIAIPVVQVDRFQVTGVEIPMEIMLGEETSVTVNYVNKGRSEVYNLSTEIDGNIQNPGQNQNLGNLASGTTGTADFYITASEVGMCTGEIKITYEDTNMEEKVATIRYNTTVKSPEEFGGGMGGGMIVGPGGVIPGEGEVIPEETKPLGLPIIIGGCVVVAVPVLFIIKKKLDKRRKEKEDADL